MKIDHLQEKVLIRNNHCLLATSLTGSILYQEHFHSHVFSKSELKEILRVINSGNFSAYIIKVNNGRILPTDDLSWVEHFNLMRLHKAGISQIAYVSPQNIFNSLEMEKELKPGKILRIKIFKKIAEAILWLENDLSLPENKQPVIASKQ